MNGIELIAAERQRQIEVEGWTPEHDDEHISGQMADAASCFARTKKGPYVSLGVDWGGHHVRVPHRWPWHASWWKPTPDDRIRELAKAGALIAAEIDRLQRLAARAAGEGE